MYKQVEKPKDNKSIAIANSTIRKKNNTNRSTSFSSCRFKEKSKFKVIQLAGHPEDILILGNKVLKRIDKIESEEYTRFSLMTDPLENNPKIPKFTGPFNTPNKLQDFIPNVDDKIAVINKWPNDKSSDYYIILDNVTGGDPAATMRDLKIGKKTASREEQNKNQGKNIIKSQWKKLKHEFLDKDLSDKQGFRDEDAQKLGLKDAQTNLVILNTTIANMRLETVVKLRKDVVEIFRWIYNSETVYVGSSMLLVTNNSNPDMSKAVMIDFAHPISEQRGFSKLKVKKYKDGMLFGVKNIHDLLLERERALSPTRPRSYF